MMYLKVHESYRKVVALADSELIGKTFEEGKKQLSITENFYKGDLMEEEKVIEALKDLALDDATFNIVGKKSINTALKAEIIAKEMIAKVQGIPFALVLL
ncbi:MAG: DUF424 domain-containing protein [Nanoarchaeota archaeon]|nr:DUF424 domain-containing protein [Nanoarchaeota archaeon]